MVAVSNLHVNEPASRLRGGVPLPKRLQNAPYSDEHLTSAMEQPQSGVGPSLMIILRAL